MPTMANGSGKVKGCPNYEVWDDPEMLMQGRDPQIEKVVTEVLKLAKEHPGRMTPAPKPDDRTAKGLNKN